MEVEKSALIQQMPKRVTISFASADIGMNLKGCDSATRALDSLEDPICDDENTSLF